MVNKSNYQCFRCYGEILLDWNLVIDWGDNSPIDFLSEPKQLGDEEMIYHTYEKSGIYEITGFMLRLKYNEQEDPLGVIHNKRFTLKINVNEGLDEDFEYFGSDGIKIRNLNSQTQPFRV